MKQKLEFEFEPAKDGKGLRVSMECKDVSNLHLTIATYQLLKHLAKEMPQNPHIMVAHETMQAMLTHIAKEVEE